MNLSDDKQVNNHLLIRKYMRNTHNLSGKVDKDYISSYIWDEKGDF